MANTKTFPGEKVDVTWDKRLCIHIGECGRSASELFESGRDPWCQPDLVEEEHVVDVCQRCPTGSLTYAFKDGSQPEQAEANNTVLVSNHGPLYMRGDLEIEGAPDDAPGLQFRAALCRCGLSKNKPYCDNSHETGDFADRGAVGETGPGLSTESGPLKVGLAPDGPLIVNGPLSIINSSGRVAWQGERVALCRCGASKNKPFCDGAHKEAGFKS